MASPCCANPLLMGWLKELYDTAVDRNTKGVTTYRKAYNAMKACPLTLTHPSEAEQLNGIGPKICAILTDKLKEHCVANGLPTPKKPRAKARKRLSAEDLADGEEPAPAKKSRKVKPYVPTLRSGPYAVILALSSLPEDSLQSLSKAELIELAQPHCDSSFTVPSEAGKFYTAWNSMKTVVDKDLVQEKGRPLRKYALTDEGWEVARRMRAAQEGETVLKAKSMRPAKKTKGFEALDTFGKGVPASANVHGFLDLEGDSDPEEATRQIYQELDMQSLTGPESASAGQRLGGAPVDRYGTFSRTTERPPERHKARNDFVDLSSSPEPPLTTNIPRVSSPLAQSISSLGPRRLEPFQPNFAQAMNLPSATSSTVAPAKRRAPSSKPPRPETVQAVDRYSAAPAPNQSQPVKPVTKPKASSSEPFQPNSAQAMNVPSDSVLATSAPKEDVTSTVPDSRAKALSSKPLQPGAVQATTVSSTGILSTSSRPPQPLATVPPILPAFTPIPIKPGSFTVRLVLDNREVRAKDDRDYISEELTKKGAKPLVRPLGLGDFFWVAKLHPPTLLSQYGEEGDEIALDWIVERKRLDDLVGSITDGRFQEQKFRLRKSGVKNITYLIEEFSLSNEKATKFHEAILSAIASTQVVNGYFVKQTKKLDDTIRYLARMTRMLKTLYESKPLYLIPTSALTPTNYLPLLTHLRTHPSHKDKSYNITYPSFASLSSKSDTLSLRDVFLKMLMCTRGISGDKALAIQKQWTTPRAFIEAFEACGSQKEKDALVETRLGGLVGRGKVKGKLAANVADVWGRNE